MNKIINQASLGNEVRISLIESKHDAMRESLLKNEHHLKELEKEIEYKYEKIEKMLEKIDNKIWSLIWWTISSFTGVLGLLSHIKGWV